MTIIILLIPLGISVSPAFASDIRAELVIEHNNKKLACAVSVPTGLEDMKSQSGVPLIVVFHGAGESYLNAVKRFRREGAEVLSDFAVIAVPDRERPFDYRTENFTVYDELIDKLVQSYPVDPTRIYLLGNSIGAAYARAFAMLYPSRGWAGLIMVSSPPPKIYWVEKVERSTFPSVFYIMGGKDRFLDKVLFNSNLEILNSKGISSTLYVDPPVAHEFRPEWNEKIFEWITKMEAQRGLTEPTTV